MIDNPVITAQSRNCGHSPLQLWLSEAAAAASAPSSPITIAGQAPPPGRSPLREQEWLVSRAMLHQCVPAGRAHSLSHSGGLAAVLTTADDVAIGVDLEVHRPRQWLRNARLVFTAGEIAAIHAASPTRAQALFYALWTMKEALAKALGLALMQALTDCHFVPDDGNHWAGHAPTDQPWSVQAFTPRPGLTLTVACVGSPQPHIQTRLWPQQHPTHWPMLARAGSGHPA